MAGDWLRLHRKALDSRVFSDAWLWRLWCWCLMKASWKTLWKDGREILPGQFTLGRQEAADQLRVSPSRLYRGLQTLQEWGQIRLEANNRFTVVTLCNWDTYQTDWGVERTTGEQLADNQRTTDEQLADTPSLFDEELKERKKERAPPRAFVKPTVEEVAAYCRERDNRVDAAAFVAHYESNGWRVGRNPMKNWKAAVVTWEKNVGAFTNGRPGKPSGPPETPEERAARLDRLAREREESRAATAPPEQVREMLNKMRQPATGRP